MIFDIANLLIEKKDFFVELLLEHLEISFLAIIIAIIIGGIVGILISEFQKATKPTLATINFLYTIPSISMLGFLIPFSGIGNATAVIALSIYALLPMIRNTHTGIMNVDHGVVDAAVAMGSTRLQTLFKVKLPLAMPVIFTGIRSMVIMTIALAGIASFIGAGGLGVAIYRGITTNNNAMTIAGSLLIAFLALIVDFALGLFEKKINSKTPHRAKSSYTVAIVCSCLALLLIFSAFVPKEKDETIHIATKPMTEQYILGEMLDILIEQDSNVKVDITQGVGGGTSNIQPAMLSGEFDIYPEYTGTSWNMVLKKDGIYTEDKFNELSREYEDNFNMKWTGMYGFNNTYGIVVRKEIAEKYNIKTYSDLKKVSKDLTFGGEYDFFERKDGFDALCETYGLSFKSTMDMDIGLKYQAINQGKIDVMNIFTTDGQLSHSDVVVLVDDKNFYPSYKCGNIVRRQVLKDHPEIETTLNKLTNSISDAEMSSMNYEVETQKQEPRAVAEKFLKEKGLTK